MAWRADPATCAAGHGGDGFIKFRDIEELSSEDLAEAVLQAAANKRFARAMLIADTCQAGTLFEGVWGLNIPNARIITVGSSKRDENSLAVAGDSFLGVPTLDRFTHALGAAALKPAIWPPRPR